MIMYVDLYQDSRGTGALALTLLLAAARPARLMCGRASMCPERSRSGPPVRGTRATAGLGSPLPPGRSGSRRLVGIFHDESLNQLEARVTVSNQTIVKAVASLQQARAVVAKAPLGVYTDGSGRDGARSNPYLVDGGRARGSGRQDGVDNSAAVSASWSRIYSARWAMPSRAPR